MASSVNETNYYTSRRKDVSTRQSQDIVQDLNPDSVLEIDHHSTLKVQPSDQSLYARYTS